MISLLGPKRRNDLSIYEEQAAGWWDSQSPYFRSLQRITPLRLELIDRWFGEVSGQHLVDFGCGGGLLALPLIERGATVTGIDLSGKALEQARKRAGSRGIFFQGDIRTFELPEQSADGAIVADVLDHIDDYELVLKNVSRCLKPQAKIFVSTINRTFISWLFAIVLGEGLGLVPRGTHDFKLFIRPHELRQHALKAGLQEKEIVGEGVHFLETLRTWAVSLKEIESTALAYSVLLERLPGAINNG